MQPMLKRLKSERKQKPQGFTIVELLVVIVIIGILAVIVVVAYNGITARAKDSERMAELNSIQKALEQYNTDYGSYPSCVNTVSSCLSVLVPNYLPALPTDPINTGSYQYRYASGYRKTGATTFVSASASDFILGDKGESGGTAYCGWGPCDLTILLGN